MVSTREGMHLAAGEFICGGELDGETPGGVVSATTTALGTWSATQGNTMANIV